MCHVYGYHAAACESLSSERAPSAPTSERRWRAAARTSTSSREARTSRRCAATASRCLSDRGDFEAQAAGDRRPVRDRPGRLRLPRPEGELVRDLRRSARAAARRRHGGHRRAERHPVVVLPRPRRARTPAARSRPSTPAAPSRRSSRPSARSAASSTPAPSSRRRASSATSRARASRSASRTGRCPTAAAHSARR